MFPRPMPEDGVHTPRFHELVAAQREDLAVRNTQVVAPQTYLHRPPPPKPPRSGVADPLASDVASWDATLLANAAPFVARIAADPLRKIPPPVTDLGAPTLDEAHLQRALRSALSCIEVMAAKGQCDAAALKEETRELLARLDVASAPLRGPAASPQ